MILASNWSQCRLQVSIKLGSRLSGSPLFGRARSVYAQTINKTNYRLGKLVGRPLEANLSTVCKGLQNSFCIVFQVFVCDLLNLRHARVVQGRIQERDPDVPVFHGFRRSRQKSDQKFSIASPLSGCRWVLAQSRANASDQELKRVCEQVVFRFKVMRNDPSGALHLIRNTSPRSTSEAIARDDAESRSRNFIATLPESEMPVAAPIEKLSRFLHSRLHR